MYESLTRFLTTFSAESPFVWALLVMVVIALTALTLYASWEVVLRSMGLAVRGSARVNRQLHRTLQHSLHRGP